MRLVLTFSPKITPIQSAKHNIYQHNSAQATDTAGKVGSGSLIHEICENERKTAVLTRKPHSDMMPSTKVPVAQLDRVSASEANDTVSQPLDSKSTYENTSVFNASCFAKTLQEHPELKQILEVWETLPEHIIAAIMALLDSVNR